MIASIAAHAAVVPAGALWAARPAEVQIIPTAVSVTLVTGSAADKGLPAQTAMHLADLLAKSTPVRRRDAAADPQTFLAECAAVRALQACAPHDGLGGKSWRVVFP
jgi:hypothetical protein